MSLQTYKHETSKWIDKLIDLYKTNKHFQRISVLAASLFGLVLFRNLLLRFTWKYVYKMPPTYKIGLPIMGVAMELLNPHVYWRNIKEPLLTTKVGTETTVIISNPESAREIYKKDINDVFDVPNSEIQFTTANGNHWEKRRQYIQQLLSTMNMNFIENSTNKFVSKLFPEFDKKAKNKEDIKGEKYFRQLGFNVVLQACIGKELTDFDDEFFMEFEKLSKKSVHNYNQQVLYDIMFQNFGYNLWYNSLCPVFFGEHWTVSTYKLGKFVEKYATDKTNIIKNKDNKLYTDFIENYKNSNEYNRDKELNINITKDQLYSDLSTMMVGATDITYSAMVACCLVAARNPDIQERVYNELKHVFGDADKFTLTNNNLFKLHLFRAFIHDVLRLYSPVSMAAFRSVKKNYKITDTLNNIEYNLPKGCSVALNIFGIHFNKNYWRLSDDSILHNDKEMHNINLGFWLNDKGEFDAKRNGKSLFAFSFGKRDCVGKSLAMKQIYMVIGLLFLKYKCIGSPNNTNKESVIELRNDGISVPVPNVFRIEVRQGVF